MFGFNKLFDFFKACSFLMKFKKIFAFYSQKVLYFWLFKMIILNKLLNLSQQEGLDIVFLLDEVKLYRNFVQSSYKLYLFN